MIDSLNEKTLTFLTLLARQPANNARFLNTVSLLEYTGARKIIKSQRAEWFSLALLDHVAEEVRHARVFKKLALRLSSNALETYRLEHLLCGAEASAYIQTLDRRVKAILANDDAQLNYLYTTLLIEERANQVYPIYETILADLGLAGFLRSIVREEHTHLKQVVGSITERDPAREGRLTQMRGAETEAFSLFLDSLLAHCRAGQSAEELASPPRGATADHLRTAQLT